MISRIELENYLNALLNIDSFQDYGPNGLQIEGADEINKVAFAVSATVDSIEKAVDWNADALIVHHGLFWKFHGVRPITKMVAARIKPIIKNNINLFGYHLPLDGHPKIGNAASIAKQLSLQEMTEFGEYKKSTTGIKGVFDPPIKASELKLKLEKLLDHNILMSSPNENAKICSLGIITGGANSGWMEAYQNGLDAFLTGEMSEHDWHDAKEAGIHFFAGGHHATEKFGVQSLLEEIQSKYPKLELKFFDSPNPA